MMIRKSLSIFVCILCLFSSPFVCAKTKCVKAVGKLECAQDPLRRADVEIYLMDKDTWNPDDTMGYTTSNEDGSFKIEGCGYDLWSNPDPYLRIFSFCGEYAGRRVDTPIRQIFVPDTVDWGTIPLD